MLYHGPVRVPADAQAGKAIIRVELPEESAFTSIATDIEVKLIKESDEDEEK
jgi:hypothetical protein